MRSAYNEQAKLSAALVQRYEETVSQFEQLKADFKACTEELKIADGEFAEGLRHVGVQLYQQFERIKQNTDEIGQATQQLSDNIASLKEETSSLTAEGCNPLRGRFDELLMDISHPSEEDKRREQDAIHDSLIQKTDDYLLDLDGFVNHYKAQNQRHQAAIQCQETGQRVALN